MAKDILKEAIAEAKAVREVALANAKAALEEAFTPKLQSMLSAKLSEELNESEEEDIEENVDEEPTIDEIDDIDEMVGMEDRDEQDEEIDLEEILNELELEDGEEAEETIDEVKDEDEEDTIDELNSPAQSHDEVANVLDTADMVNEGGEFDLDALLEEINNLDEGFFTHGKDPADTTLSDALRKLLPGKENAVGSWDEFKTAAAELGAHKNIYADSSNWKQYFNDVDEGFNSNATNDMRGEDLADLLPNGSNPASSYEDWYEKVSAGYPNIANNTAWQSTAKKAFAKVSELHETKRALKAVKSELNEVNLLNSKLLYVNRIFKANTLDDVQKLRVVETLDKAESAKEAKLIYETIKDTFTISKGRKAPPKRSIREGLGMASKAAGKSTAPRKAVLNESNDMVARMQKLANITIKQ